VTRKLLRIATTLQAGQSKFQILVWAIDFSLLQNVQTGSDAHPTLFNEYWCSYLGVKWPGLDADHYPPSCPQVKNLCGDTLLLTLYAYMAWTGRILTLHF
jgi:hypothetical protein